MLCSLVDQAPNDVIDGAVEADPQQIYNIAANHRKSQW